MALALRISSISVDAADLAEIKRLIEQNRSRWAQQWLLTNESGEADVVIIDTDSIYGHMDWLKAHSAGRKIIALSNRPGNDNEATLLRPITLASLNLALTHFGGGATGVAPQADAPPSAAAPAAAPVVAPPVVSAPAPAPAAAPPAIPSAAPPVAAKPATTAAPTGRTTGEQPRFQAPELLRPASAPKPAAEPPKPAAPEPVAVAPAPPEPVAPPPPAELNLVDYCSMDVLPETSELARPGLPTLTIDSGADCYYGPPSLKALAPYCKGHIARDEWKKPSDKALSDLRQAGAGQPLTRLVWLATLIGSSGHLLPGLDLNARYKLARWPQIEREFPKHFRIATVMMKGPATLTEISEQSGALLADAIDFINAYAVIGVAEMEGTPAAAAASEPTGLLARWRARGRRS